MLAAIRHPNVMHFYGAGSTSYISGSLVVTHYKHRGGLLPARGRHAGGHPLGCGAALCGPSQQGWLRLSVPGAVHQLCSGLPGDAVGTRAQNGESRGDIMVSKAGLLVPPVRVEGFWCLVVQGRACSRRSTAGCCASCCRAGRSAAGCMGTARRVAGEPPRAPLWSTVFVCKTACAGVGAVGQLLLQAYVHSDFGMAH